jgi:hypothetical protein
VVGGESGQSRAEGEGGRIGVSQEMRVGVGEVGLRSGAREGVEKRKR